MSGKTLLERLQVKRERRLALVGAPPDLDAALGGLDRRAEVARADVVLLFARDQVSLSQALPAMLAAARPDAILWLAYPKLSSALADDLSRDVIHAIAPGYGLATVAAVAVDADWSALRLKRAPGLG